MSQMGHREKVFQPDNNGPDERLVAETYPDTQKFELHHEKRTDNGWRTVGVLENQIGVWWDTGTFESHGPIFEWSWTHYHATGDRTRNDHQILDERTGDSVVLRHQNRREEVLGFGDREEYDWRTVAEWRVTADGEEVGE